MFEEFLEKICIFCAEEKCWVNVGKFLSDF